MALCVVVLNTAKDHRRLHRTAKDPRKTATDLTGPPISGPLLFIYFLFGYQKMNKDEYMKNLLNTVESSHDVTI